MLPPTLPQGYIKQEIIHIRRPLRQIHPKNTATPVPDQKALEKQNTTQIESRISTHGESQFADTQSINITKYSFPCPTFDAKADFYEHSVATETRKRARTSQLDTIAQRSTTGKQKFTRALDDHGRPENFRFYYEDQIYSTQANSDFSKVHDSWADDD